MKMTEDEVKIYEAERLARWQAWCVKHGFNQDVAEGWMSMSDYVDRGIFAEWDEQIKRSQRV